MTNSATRMLLAAGGVCHAVGLVKASVPEACPAWIPDEVARVNTRAVSRAAIGIMLLCSVSGGESNVSRITRQVGGASAVVGVRTGRIACVRAIAGQQRQH